MNETETKDKDTQEENKENTYYELQKILHQYITEEEIENLKRLEKKAIEAEEKVKEYVMSKLEPREESGDTDKKEGESESPKKLPYYVDVVVSLDVKKSENKNMLPYTILQDSKKYEIDFVSDNCNLFIENFYEEIEEIITKRCKQLPIPEKE